MLKLTPKEFKLLLLIHAAKCDYHYHDNEKLYIEDLADENLLKKLYKIYDEEKVASFSIIIKYFNEYFPTTDERLQLRQELMELFHIDGKYCQFEQGFEKFFNTMADIKT